MGYRLAGMAGSPPSRVLGFLVQAGECDSSDLARGCAVESLVVSVVRDAGQERPGIVAWIREMERHGPEEVALRVGNAPNAFVGDGATGNRMLVEQILGHRLSDDAKIPYWPSEQI